jgi:VanZ like family
VTRRVRWGRVATALGAAAIAGVTLRPEPDAAVFAAATPIYCLVCGERGGVDVLLNILLFLPLGIGLRLAGASLPRAVAAAAAASLVVELLQLTVIVGRDASLSDLLSNTAGGALGAGLAVRLPRLAHPSPRDAWSLLRWGAAAWMVTLALAGWLQGPWLADGSLMSAAAVGRPGSEKFAGMVRVVKNEGVLLPVHGVPDDSARVRRALREGRVALEVDFITGPAGRERRWIYVLGVDGTSRLSLAQHRRSAVLAVPARSVRLRLNPPTVVLPDAFPDIPGRSVTLRAGERGHRIWLESTRDDGATRSLSLALSPAHGWALITPYSLGLSRSARVVTAALLFLLVLPLGYWAGHTEAGPRAAGMIAAVIVASLGVVPWLQGYSPVHWTEWLAALAAAAAGWAARSAAAYLQHRCGSPSTSESSSS